MQNILPIRKQLKFAIGRLILVLQDPMYINVEFIFVAVVGSPLVWLVRFWADHFSVQLHIYVYIP